MIRTDNFKTLLILIGLLINYLSQAQFQDNRINLYAAFETGNFIGRETVNENNFISPSLYSNFRSQSGFSLKASYRLKSHFGFGTQYSYSAGSNWHSQNYSDFKFSESSLHSLSLFIRFLSGTPESGLLNKLSFFSEAGINGGLSTVNIGMPQIQKQGGSELLPEVLTDMEKFWGLYFGAGFEYKLSSITGVFFNSNLIIDYLKPELYGDKKILCLKHEIGLFIRFKNDKRFY